jgi:hypothetical protein
MAQVTDDELLESTLAGQIPEVLDQPEVKVPAEVEEPKNVNPASQYLGQSLNHKPGESPFQDKEADKKLAEEKKLSRIGEKIQDNAEVREGWIDVPRSLLGERSRFYPESWSFRIRPATVEAIRNWSTIDDENISSVDDVFNEVLKSCLAINTPNGPLPWGNICSWDRFFFVLLIREYTFVNGESKITYEDECINCENPIKFELNSQTLNYEYPDPELYSMYDQETRTWRIDPAEYDVDGEPFELYVPTLEKDANIKQWLISWVQENRNRKVDPVFIRFLIWMAPKISKDQTIARRQIREYQAKFKSYDVNMFGFMDEVIKNITVTQGTSLTQKCPICGEEVTSQIRFQGSVSRISDLFNVQSGRKKFGSK